MPNQVIAIGGSIRVQPFNGGCAIIPYGRMWWYFELMSQAADISSYGTRAANKLARVTDLAA